MLVWEKEASGGRWDGPVCLPLPLRHPDPGDGAHHTGSPAQGGAVCELLSEEDVDMSCSPQTFRIVILHCLLAWGISSMQGSRSLSPRLPAFSSGPKSRPPALFSFSRNHPGLQPPPSTESWGLPLPEWKVAEPTGKHDTTPNCPLWPHPPV